MSTSAATASVFSSKAEYDEQVRGLDLKVNSFCISDAGRYEQIISEVMGARNRTNKKPLDYRRLKRYDVLKVSDKMKLILPLCKSAGNQVKYYVHNGELFDILCKAHVDTGHGGLHKMHLSLKKKYVNITRPVIQIFLANCKTCAKKRSKRHRADRTGLAAITPGAPSHELSTTERAQVDLIDMESCTDDGYDFVLKYKDCASKFVVLRALRTRAADEIARHLIDIFCTFGAPAVLQSDTGAAFLDGVTRRLNESTTWPGLEIAPCGKTRGCHGQDLRDHLRSWMIDNKSDRWCEGLRFCQYQRNITPHSVIGRSPFEALFGKKPQGRFTAAGPVAPGYGENGNATSGGLVVDSDPLDCSTNNRQRTVRKNTYHYGPQERTTRIRRQLVSSGAPLQVQKRVQLQDITYSKCRSDKKSQT